MWRRDNLTQISFSVQSRRGRDKRQQRRKKVSIGRLTRFIKRWVQYQVWQQWDSSFWADRVVLTTRRLPSTHTCVFKPSSSQGTDTDHRLSLWVTSPPFLHCVETNIFCILLSHREVNIDSLAYCREQGFCLRIPQFWSMSLWNVLQL